MLALCSELISDILLRLPVKSLLRFRCISNSLCTEIDSSDFAKNHLKRSTETKTGRKFIIQGDDDIYASDFDDGFRKVIKINSPFIDEKAGWISIRGACAGLVLFTVYDKEKTRVLELFLWNPTTRRCKKLATCLESGEDFRDTCYIFRSCSLGYDSAADDYKVVMILEVYHKYRFNNEKTGQVWIFSLKSNSWRWSQDFSCDIWNFKLKRSSRGFVNGVLYWESFVARDLSVHGFDIANEMFFTLPNFYQHQGGLIFSSMSVLEIEGYVLACYECKEGVLEFYMFVSEEGGPRRGGNWRRAFNIEKPKWVVVAPVAYSKDGDCILFQFDDEYFWYDFKEEQRKIMVEELRGLPSSIYDCYVCLESLVSLDSEVTFRFDEEELKKQ